MTAFISWYPELLPYAAGLSAPAVITAVRDAAVEFCRRTHLWRITLDRFSVVADQQDYTLTMPAAELTRAEIEIVDEVYFKATGAADDQFKQLDPISEEQMNNHSSWSAWRFDTAPEPSKYWVDVLDKQLHLVPIPDTAATNGLLVYVIAKPMESSTTLPDFLYRDWKAAITAGALYYLLGNQNSPYYDLQGSLMAKQDFDTRVGGARHMKVSGATKRPSMIQIPFFA